MSRESLLFTATRCCLSLLGAAGLGVLAALLTAAAALLVTCPVAGAVGAGLVTGVVVLVVSAPLLWRSTW